MTVTAIRKDPDTLSMTLTADFDATPERVWQPVGRSSPTGTMVGTTDLSGHGHGPRPDAREPS